MLDFSRSAEDLNPGPHACTDTPYPLSHLSSPVGSVILYAKHKCSRIFRKGEEEKAEEL